MRLSCWLLVLTTVSLLGCGADSEPPETTAPTAEAEPSADQAAPPTAATEDLDEPGAVVMTGQVFESAEAALKSLEQPEARPYLFYLHGAILEGGDRRPTSERFGIYEYDEILKRLADAGLVVVSEQRPAATNVDTYSAQVVKQVEQLKAAGVASGQITVAGFSKGGSIALYVADRLADDDVGFVILAACGSWLDEIPLNPRGRMLSIYEASDELGRSCRPMIERAETEVFFHETEISLGGGHGAFYRPHDDWLNPALLWSNAPATRQQLVAPKRLQTGPDLPG